MCDFITPTVLAASAAAMSATQAVVGYMGAAQQARQTNNAYRQNADAAIVAYQDDIEASNLDTMAAQEQATQRRLQTTSEGLAARGAARAASGERGVGGYSVAAIQRDLGFQEGSNIAAINRNAGLDKQRHRMNVRGARDASQSRINAAPRSRGPSLLALGAQLGSAALDGYTMRSTLRANAAAGAG